MKGKSKRIVSGFLSALTIISSIMQPVTTYAAEAEPAAYEAEYPDMEKVKGALAEDEIVRNISVNIRFYERVLT